MTRHFSAVQLDRLDQRGTKFPPDTRFAVFVGFGHSGHSLVGALLDAHPNAAIANELNVLRQIQEHELQFEQLQRLTLACSAENDRDGAWTNTGYEYRVAGGGHGRVAQICVLGDKKGGGTARLIDSDPDLWNQLVAMAGTHLRVICVLRHPLDMLAAASFRRGIEPDEPSADRIVANARAVVLAQSSVPDHQFFLLRHEDFLQDPRTHLGSLCRFLELDTAASYLDACMQLVRPGTHERRFKIVWPNGLPEYLERNLQHQDIADLFATYSPLIESGRVT